MYVRGYPGISRDQGWRDKSHPEVSYHMRPNSSVHNLDLLKKELWNGNLAKKRKKTQQIELRQAPIVGVYLCQGLVHYITLQLKKLGKL
jgi:hypothetical protein